MKFEIDSSKLKLSKWVWVFIIGLIIGATLGLVATIYTPEPIFTLREECLTATDLNRSDIGASIVLSRFCEGMGLQSSVLWQQDSQGNEYGVPICLRG